jgi:hypothetical protein
MGSDRAAERRATWTGGVVRSFAEAETMHLEFWLSATPTQRIRGVTELMQEMYTAGGEDGPPPRFQRTVGGLKIMYSAYSRPALARDTIVRAGQWSQTQNQA